jgi:hypothetical protein
MLIIVQVHDMFFFSLFLNKDDFENVLIPYKFNVLSLKMIIISNCDQLFFKNIFMFSCIVNYNSF